MRVYRWDLDKTYLETDFDSVRSLVRTALEPAAAKRAVPGARALLRALSRQPGARISILSGSPVQMRAVLAEKLSLDGVRFDELRLKDNLGNLKRGRIRAIKEQFGYKLPALFEGRTGLGGAAREVLFGDDAEVDALVYSVYADAVSGRLDLDSVKRIMRAAGAYPDQVAHAARALDRLGVGDPVRHIFIHLDRGSPTQRFSALGGRVIPVQSWLQAALVLAVDGDLSAAEVVEVARDVVEGAGMGPGALANLAQDIVRRGHVAKDPVVEILGDPAWLAMEGGDRVGRRLAALPPGSAPDPGAPLDIDYVKVLKSWNVRQDK